MNAFTKSALFVCLGAWALLPGVAVAQTHSNHGQAHKGKADATKPALPLCPVMGDPIDFSIKTMAADGPVYFCCKGCIKAYEKDSAKFAEKTATQRAALKKMKRIQVNCPVTGSPIDRETIAVVGGTPVAFCCKGCVAKYEASPAKYKPKLEASYTYQVTCPVANEPIDPHVYADLPGGPRVYFCCAGCDKKFLSSPGTYAAKLAAQGVDIDVKKTKPARHTGHDHDHGHGKP